jgi:hypothetical protein
MEPERKKLQLPVSYRLWDSSRESARPFDGLNPLLGRAQCSNRRMAKSLPSQGREYGFEPRLEYQCGYSLVVKRVLAKYQFGVRFSVAAPSVRIEEG